MAGLLVMTLRSHYLISEVTSYFKNLMLDFCTGRVRFAPERQKRREEIMSLLEYNATEVMMEAIVKMLAVAVVSVL
jgi:hypothetical protein